MIERAFVSKLRSIKTVLSWFLLAFSAAHVEANDGALSLSAPGIVHMRDLGNLKRTGNPEGRVRISDREQRLENLVWRQSFPEHNETSGESDQLTEDASSPADIGLFTPTVNGNDPTVAEETLFNAQSQPYHAEWVPYVPGLEGADESHFLHCAELLPDLLTQFNHPLAKISEAVTCSEHDIVHTELDALPIGLQEIPDRPNLLIELNEDFLAPGVLSQGIVLPTGAVWRPSLWVFGTYRTGFNYQERTKSSDVVELAERLDLFAQLNLSGTERVLLGLRPVDEETRSSRRFLSYDFQDGRVIDGWNADIQTLFFEGDFGEIFPRLDPYDRHRLDIGFSVGRQPMSFQQGLLVNEDRVDALTATRNTVSGKGLLNLRMTGAYVWNEIHRNNNQLDPDAQLVGVFTESDFARSTVNADIAYLHSQSSLGSQLAFGLSAIQRLHGLHITYNTSVHVLGSLPTEGETTASGRGVLLFSQTSWTPHHTSDLIYLNGFWAIDQFTSPMRGTLAGGPLGQTGILFAAPGLGRFGAPLNNQASDVAGGSLGYQLFFDHTKQQVIFEVGGRQPTNEDDAQFGSGARYQKAINQHWILVIDAFATKQESQHWTPGSRIELLAKF